MLRISTIAFVVIAIIAINVPSASSAPLSSSLRDTCGHTLSRPGNFLVRHLKLSLFKRIFKHLNPFSSSRGVKMQFYLYKRDFAECGREIVTDVHNTLDMSEFNPSHPTRIIIHGWMSHSRGGLNRAVKTAYLNLVKRVPQPTDIDFINDHSKVSSIDSPPANDDNFANNIASNYQSDYNTSDVKVSDLNVIVCDWSTTASNMNYFSVVDMVEDLGRLLADFVYFLHDSTSLNYQDVYLIGHSMGAQIAGSAGKQSFPYRFNTIYALDPAGPKFRNQSTDYRLDPSDAEYVESIQTSNSLGFEEPVGHASFYPNYGHDQQKCHFYGCSHRRSYHYFAESINSQLGFWGTACRRESDNVWIFSDTGTEYRMGGEPSTPKNGTFYVKTADRPPFALGRNVQPFRMDTAAVDAEADNGGVMLAPFKEF